MSSVELAKAKKMEILTALEQGGTLTPEAVVDAAAPTEHPFHDYFDWDDTTAGHQWRIHQARTLIRSVKVVMQLERIAVSHVHYVHDPELERGEAGYAPIIRIKTKDEAAADLMSSEIERACSALRRAQEIALALESPKAKPIGTALSKLSA